MNNEVSKTMSIQQFFSRIYAVMAMGVGVSAITSILSLTVFRENVISLLNNGGTVPLLFVWVAEIALVIWLSRSSVRDSGMALPGFFLYSALNGFVLSITLAFYDINVVGQAFVTAALTFAGMAVFGARTSKNLSGMGQAFISALWGVIVAMLLNAFFFHNGAMGMLISLVSVVIFAGLTAYDNQNIKNVYYSNNGEVREGWAIYMALSLYLDFINLFLALIRIFGSRD
ncbi:MAG: Bax inhibitor-1/YccA family protein [Lactobacillales bacterium]|jgi:FtsH-binding integral membrane protein|nr:Bax inhibitor-1/YccA family protein [Lactobacillales bacterium]